MLKPDWLPDGKNISDYPDPKTASAARWSWEFLRRNEEFQKDAENAAELFMRPAEITQDSVLFSGQADAIQLMEKWGFFCWHIPDPSKPGEWHSPEIAMRFFGHELTLHPAKSPLDGRKSTCPMLRFDRESEVVIKVDLEFRIDEQLKALRETLLELQSTQYSSPVSRARRPEKLIDYLRAHDGRLAGMSEYEVGKLIYAGLKASKENLKSKIDADMDAASLLIAKGYRYLRLTSGKD